MPKIPTYFSRASLDTDRGGMPRVPVNDQLGSHLKQLGRVIGGIRANFNANQPPRASENNGERSPQPALDRPKGGGEVSPVEAAAEDEIRQHYELRVAERAAFNSAIGLDRLVDTVRNEIAVKAQNNSGDGRNFYADALDRIIEPALQSFLAEQDSALLPEADRAAREQLEILRQTAAVTEAGLTKKHSLEQLASAKERARSEIRADPSNFDSVSLRFGRQVALSGLNSQERDAIGKGGLKDFSLAVLDHAINSEPDGIDQLLGLRQVDTGEIVSAAARSDQEAEKPATRAVVFDFIDSSNPAADTIAHHLERTYGSTLDAGQNAQAIGLLDGFLHSSPEGRQAVIETARAYSQPAVQPKRGDLVVNDDNLALYDGRDGERRKRIVVSDGEGDFAITGTDPDADLSVLPTGPAAEGSLLQAALVNGYDESVSLIEGRPDQKLGHLSPGERIRERRKAQSAINQKLEIARRRRRAERAANANALDQAIDGGQYVAKQDILDAELSGDDRARLDFKLQARTNQASRSRELLRALAEGNVDMDLQDEQQTAAADYAWQTMEPALDERTRHAAARDFFRKTGFIPSRVRARLAHDLSADDPEELTRAIAFAQELRKDAPASFDRSMAEYADIPEVEQASKLIAAGFTFQQTAERILETRLLGQGPRHARDRSRRGEHSVTA